MCAIKASLSRHGPYSFRLRIADAEIAVRSAIAAEKTNHATLIEEGPPGPPRHQRSIAVVKMCAYGRAQSGPWRKGRAVAERQGCSTLQCHAAPGHGEAEGSRGRPVRHHPICVVCVFCGSIFLAAPPVSDGDPGPTARKPPRQSARFSTAKYANNANGPATTQAPGEAFDLRTRVAGSDSLSLRSVNRER